MINGYSLPSCPIMTVIQMIRRVNCLGDETNIAKYSHSKLKISVHSHTNKFLIEVSHFQKQSK